MQELSIANNATTLEEALLFYMDNPVEWVEDTIGSRPDLWQRDLLNSLSKRRFVSVRSGHGVGKSTVASWSILWFICTHPFCKIIATAPTKEQLFDVLWAECYKWIRMSQKLSQMLEWTQEKIFVRSNPEEWFAVARTAEVRKLGKTGLAVAEGLQGRHADSVFYLLDEACHDDQTEILTDRGWISFPKLANSDATYVVTKNPDLDIVGLVPFDPLEFDYVGPLCIYTTRTTDFAVTPKHKMWYRPFKHQSSSSGEGSDEYRFDPIENIGSNRLYIPRTLGSWDGEEPEYFTLPPVETDWGYAKEEKDVPIEPWLELLGWFLSEGSVCRQNGKPTGISIAQSARANSEKFTQIAIVLSKLPFAFKAYPFGYIVSSSHAACYLDTLGRGALNKSIPDFVRTLSPRLIKLFLATFHAGDGYLKGARDKRIFYTSSKYLADGLQELILLSGSYASVTTRNLAGVQSLICEEGKEPRVITSTCDGYVVSEFVDPTEEHCVRRHNITQTQYSGKVYCVDAPPFHLIYTRRNGKCMWSGNSGIEEAIMSTVDGALTSEDSYVLMTGNPTRCTGTFYDSFHSKRAMWDTYHVNSEESPRVAKAWCDRMLDKYGSRDHPMYLIRVRGEFPPALHNSVFSLDSIEESMVRKLEVSPYDPVEIGVDVARYGGDLTAFAIKQGPKVLRIDTYPQISTMETAGRCIKYIQEFRPISVKIDVVGVGAGVYDRLHELNYKECIPINMGSSPIDEKQFFNLRAEAHWHLRTRLEQKLISLPPDEDFIAQATSLTYKISSRGKIQIESKEDLRDRGVKSPDRLDAVVLACMPAQIVQASQHFVLPVSIFAR